MNKRLSKLELFDLKIRLQNAKSADMISLLPELVSLGANAVEVETELTEKIEEGVYFPRVDRLAEVVANTRSSELLEVVQASEQITLNSSAHAILLEAGFGQFEKALITRIEQQVDNDPLGGWNWKEILNSLIKAGTQQSTNTLEWFESKLNDRIDRLKNKASSAPDTPSSVDELFEPKYLVIYDEMLALTYAAIKAASTRSTFVSNETPKAANVESVAHDPLSMIGTDLDNDIGRVELELRSLTSRVLNEQSQSFPDNVMSKAQQRIGSKIKKCALTDSAQFETMDRQLQYFDLSELKDTIQNKTLWKYFEPFFKNKDEFTTRFNQLSEARNTIRHLRVADEIVFLDGETAVKWFLKILKKLR